MFLRSFLTTLLLLGSLGPLAAQLAEADSSRPKVGLVLSGGGAKALAHIGALKVIDSLGIQLDYIGGTSMGAIIGALYSMGYSPEELEVAMRSINWEALLANEQPRQGLSFLDKGMEDRYLVSFPVRNNRIALPSAINYGQSILKELAWLTQKAHAVNDFSELPIPFYCVATDIVNGRAVVLDTGNLADALRASSAFPSLFSPYEVNGILLADGGLMNNLPVKQMKEKGMDLIIALDVQTIRYKKEEINSVFRILEQTSGFINAENYERDFKDISVLVKPEVPGAGIATFDMFDSIIHSGKRAALLNLEELRKIAEVSPRTEPRHTLRGGVPEKELDISEVRIYGNESSTERFMLSKLRISAPTRKSLKQLNKAIDRLYGTQIYQSVDYRLEPTAAGAIMHLRVKERKEKAMFRLGVHYDDDFQTAILFNYTKRNLFLKNSKLSADLAVGQSPRGLISYTYDRGYVPTLGLRLRANQFDSRLYANRQAITEYTYRDLSVELFLQSTILDVYAWGGGIQYENIDLRDEVNFFPLPVFDTNLSYLNYFAFIKFDSFDRTFNPRNGMQFKGQYRTLSRQVADDGFLEPTSVLDLQWQQAIPLGSKVAMTARAYGATTIGGDADYPYNIFLGGLGQNYVQYIFPFIGYNYMELLGRNALVLRADIYYEFLDHHFVQFKGNVGKIESTFDGLFNSNYLLDGYGLSYAYESPFGPLEFTLMKSSNHTDWLTYVSLGYWF